MYLWACFNQHLFCVPTPERSLFWNPYLCCGSRMYSYLTLSYNYKRWLAEGSERMFGLKTTNSKESQCCSELIMKSSATDWGNLCPVSLWWVVLNPECFGSVGFRLSSVTSLVSVQIETPSLTGSHPVLGQRPTTTLIDMRPFRQERKQCQTLTAFLRLTPFISRTSWQAVKVAELISRSEGGFCYAGNKGLNSVHVSDVLVGSRPPTRTGDGKGTGTTGSRGLISVDTTLSKTHKRSISCYVHVQTPNQRWKDREGKSFLPFAFFTCYLVDNLSAKDVPN